MNILVFGAQGSGKSTHAKYIADKLIPVICLEIWKMKIQSEAEKLRFS